MNPTDNNDTQAASAEQAADLRALEAAASADPAAQAQAQAEDQAAADAAQAGADLAAELGALVRAAVAALSPAFPSLATIYTDATIPAAAGAVAAVCNKHGWLQGGVFGKWGEEIAALAIVGPLAVATVQGVRGDIAARKPKAQALEGGGQAPTLAPAAPDPSRTVIVGTVQPSAA